MKTWPSYKAGTAAREAAVITDAFNTAAIHLKQSGGSVTRTIEHALKAAMQTPIKLAAKSANQ